ncbi:MAG: hypothetical protein HYY06_12050 [Deltaproteobacteria bacterium]|nr:hypothetical protein [Deltaproteobacteria bacterium]
MRLFGCTALAACVTGCGVLAAPADVPDELPDARLGPFRKLDELEADPAPFVEIDYAAELGGPAVLATGSRFELYFHATLDAGGAPALRLAAGDGATAFGEDEVILEPEDEIGLVDPAAIRTWTGDDLLFYAAATGDWIRLARREEAGFVPGGAPVLERGRGPAIGAPSLLELDDELLLYFERGDLIELAVSADGGATWAERGPVLFPDEGWDAGGVGDPSAILYTSPLGRRSVRLYYTGRSLDDPPVAGIGVAASFDGAGDFDRLVGNPLFDGDRDEQAPAALDVGGATVLYFSQSSAGGRPAIAAAVAPGDVRF